MDQASLFTAALGLQPPWGVVDVRFSEPARRIDFEVAFEQGARFVCPSCGAEAQPAHDTLEREWRHLNFFQFEGLYPCPYSACALRSLWQDHAGCSSLGAFPGWFYPVDGGLDHHPVQGHARCAGS